MRKAVIFVGLVIFLSLTHLSLSAQYKFAPIGAEWFFTSQYCYPFENCGYIHLEAIKDTVILDQPCVKVISDTLGGGNFFSIARFPTNSLFFYSDSGKVFHFDELNQEFYKLYDFTLDVGDTLTIQKEKYRGYGDTSLNQFSPFQVRVDSITILSIDTFLLRKYHFSPIADGFTFWYGVIEKIGAVMGLFGYYDALPAAGYMGFARCYLENQNLIFSNGELSCNYLGIPDLSSDSEKFLISPNPSNGNITILLPEIMEAEQVDISFYDVCGRFLLKKVISRPAFHNGPMNLELQLEGLVFIEIKANNFIHNQMISFFKF